MRAGRVIDSILFDVGETLLEFGPERKHLRAGLRMGYDHLREQGCPLPSFERYARRLTWGLAARLVWSRWLTRRELLPVAAVQAAHRRMGISLDLTEAARVADRFYAAIGVERRAAEGARTALQALREDGYRLAIISNTFAPPGGLDQHLEAEGLLEFFPVRIYSCEVGYMKPDRRIFECALERMGAEARSSMYVGDKAPIDVRGAGRIGMLTVLKLAPGTPQPGRWRPDHVIETLAELPEIVRKYGRVRAAVPAADPVRL